MYSEIKLTDDERKLLEVLKSQEYENIGKELYPGEECHSDVYGRTGRVQDFLLLDWFDGFDWMDYNDEYEIEKLLNPPHEPKTVWDLEDGDVFWAINSRGHVYRDTWSGGDFDVECRNQGNIFLTEEEAKFESKRREVVSMVRKYASPYTRNEPNWYPYYSHSDKKICIDFNDSFQQSYLYFNSQEAIIQAIAEVGKDDFKKYYLGVAE